MRLNVSIDSARYCSDEFRGCGHRGRDSDYSSDVCDHVSRLHLIAILVCQTYGLLVMDTDLAKNTQVHAH